MAFSINNIIEKRQYRQINFRMLVRVMGWLIMLESLFMIVPMCVSLAYHESAADAFGITAVVTFVCGLLMNFLSRPQNNRMSKREGFLLTGMTWVVFSIFGMLPFIISDAPYTVIEAFTEAMSGFTTTGAPTVADVSTLEHGVNIWRAEMQWIGGMGILVFTIAVIPTLNYSGGMQIFNAEATGITHDKIRPRITETARSLWMTYILMTVVMFVLMLLGPMDAFDSVVYSLVTVATGGGGCHNEGICYFGSNYIKVVATVFMFLGSVNFALIYNCFRGDFKSLRTNAPLMSLVKVNVIFAVLFLLCEVYNGTVDNWWDTIVSTVFVVTSASSTTGYAQPGIEKWGYFVSGATMVLMFFGGCAGSTSGGAKIDRFIVMLKYAKNEIHRALQPNNITSVKLGNRTLNHEIVQKVIAFLCIDAIIVVVTSMLLTVIDIPLTDAFYSAVACISNSMMGLNMGHYQSSLAAVPEAGKLLLSFIMLIGRLEFYTILVLFTSSFWHK